MKTTLVMGHKRTFLALGSILASCLFPASAEPLRIGAIADCQFADIAPAGQRLYRTCPGKLEEAVTTLNEQELSFVVHLGDFIDRDAASFAPLLAITEASRHPFRFVLGNHDLAVADHEKLSIPQRLSMPARYYSMVEGGWVFLFLDGNDLSTYGWPEGSARDLRSKQVHAERFPEAPTWDGGIGSEQLAWMEGKLTEADLAGRRVVLFSHFPVYPPNRHNLWNTDEVLALLDRHPSVALWMSGHNHEGHYGLRGGVHHLTLKGMLDTPENAYALVTLHTDRIDVKGFGREADRSLFLAPQTDDQRP